ncbi:hypothetical protein [Spirochaeta thermophila]|nr:hypothetical protein [Spirochaeta thermophila]
MLLGISALFAGITAGVIISSQMALFFHRIGDGMGFRASIAIIVSMVVGMASKIATMYVFPMELTIVFLLSMGVKSVGLCVIGMTFFRFSEEDRRVRLAEA